MCATSQTPRRGLRALALAAALALLPSACDRDDPRDERAHTADGALARPDIVHRTSLHMGTIFTITVATEHDPIDAIEAAVDELDRVERGISTWRPDSDATRVNEGAGGEPVFVGPDLLEVARVAREVSELTGGAFDITFAACADHWSWDPPRVPSDAELASCLPDVGYTLVELDLEHATLRLARPDARLGLGGIGKGYGLDRAAQVLRDRGFDSFVVEGGGDLVASGTRFGEPWRVGVQAPRGRRGQLTGALALPASGAAVATSGDYEHFGETPSGERVHHVLDPRTGRPARGAVAATVIAPDGTHADALATGLLVMGPDDGLALVERLEGVEALIYDDAGAPHLSSGFARFLDGGATTSP